ncbi:MAG: efflux RND transporter periplasmic adaptor subunit [Candidatus Thiodiazotropha endolucinida]
MRLRVLLSLLFAVISVSGLFAAENLVQVKAAVQREIQSGFTRAHSKLTLSAEQAGRITSVNADIGDRIEEGVPFACLDDTYLDLELRANEAERKAMKVDKAYFRKEVARYSKLLKKNSSTQSQMDTAQRNLDKTQTQIEALIIAAEILKERKERLCIEAPAGWRVIARHVEPGKWVSAGEPVVEIGDYSRLVAPFALSVAEYQALQTQADVGLKVYLPELKEELPARIIRISPAFDEQSRKIHLELELSTGLPAYRGGLRVDLALDIPMRSGAVLIPERALQQRYEQYWLKRPDGNEIAVVYLGRSNGPQKGWVRVVSPEIKPGDRFQVFDE